MADVIVRFAPAGRQLPIGVVTALLGVPFFLALVLRMRLEWRG
jgi:iron complex transport system permease protein